MDDVTVSTKWENPAAVSTRSDSKLEVELRAGAQ
jgi:hypothetical protein